MEIRVAPKVTGQTNQTNSAYDIYFTNSFQNTSNWCQKEATYEAKYTASFPVMGGGTLTLRHSRFELPDAVELRLRREPDSCDTSAARMIDMPGANPAPPTPFSQPRTASLGGTTFYLQWIYIDVTSVTSP